MTDAEAIKLPKPKIGGAPGSLMHALANRCTTREIAPTKLESQLLADLLWAAYGTNRVQGPFGQTGKTAASASNSQEISIYVLLEEVRLGAIDQVASSRFW
jgi:hypothetical protein